MNIILVGFRCAGKTTAGKLLAERLARDFIDTDDHIERETQMTIRQIFDTRGESYFRLLESNTLSELAKLDGKVIATGGGAVLKYKNMCHLRRNGVVIFLDVDPDVAHERILKDKAARNKRPPLTAKDLHTEIREQIVFRKPYYLKTADFEVDTSKKPVEKVVEEITILLKKRGVIENS